MASLCITRNDAPDNISQAVEICSYGNDVYLLTSEYDRETSIYYNYLWLNGNLVMSYPNVEASGFTVF